MLVSSDVSRAPKDIIECEEKKSETYVQTEWEKKHRQDLNRKRAISIKKCFLLIVKKTTRGEKKHFEDRK